MVHNVPRRHVLPLRAHTQRERERVREREREREKCAGDKLLFTK